MVICATLVSTSFTVGAAITAEIDPAVLTLVRFLLAACIFGPWVYYRYGLNFSWSYFFRCSLISGCLVIFFWCMFFSLRYTTALNTSVIFALVPSISGGYALILNRERLSKERLLALFCGMIGVIWVIFKGDLALLFSTQWNRGDLIFLAGCFAMGLYTPLIQLLHKGESMAVMTFWVLVTGVCWLLLLAAPKFSTMNLTDVPTFAWLGVLYLAVFTTIITFFLTQYSVPFLGSTRVMAYSYLYPGLVLLIDLALGHTPPPLIVIPGIIVILAATFILQRSPQKT
jgi:drug/metabolite transporter (DMT)-like permease